MIRFDLLISLSPEEFAKRDVLSKEETEESLEKARLVREEAERDCPTVIPPRVRFR